MNKKLIVFIINPKSGVERVKELKQLILTTLNLENFDYEIWHTKYAKHGKELAKQAIEKNAIAVVAVGGDGSINDIASSLIGSKLHLAIVPKGSGNGLARTLQIPLIAEQAIALINKFSTAPIDIATANDALFLSNAGIGYDALIAKKFAHSEQRGLRVYAWLVSKYLWLYKSRFYKVVIDGVDYSGTYFLINVANGQQFGYNFKIAPDAHLQDGLLDVVMIKPFPKIYGIVLAWHAYRGTILKSSYVHRVRAKEILISNDQLKLAHLDGDSLECDREVMFKVYPNALSIIQNNVAL